MYNIRYTGTQLTWMFGQLIDIAQPFDEKIDRRVRKCKLHRLIVSPDTTRNCAQMKRFVVPFNKRYAYRMHATYRDKIKCHAVYDVDGKGRDKAILFRACNYILNNINEFDKLDTHLITVIGLILKAWTFDGILTDIPWLTEKHLGVPVMQADWNLIKYEKTSLAGRAMNMVLKQFGSIPLNTLNYDQIISVTRAQTNIPKIPFRCPLILMKTNTVYAGWLANILDRGLPSVMFKVQRVK